MIAATGFEGLRFFTTPWTILISAVLVAATVVVAFLTWRRSGCAAGTGLVELLRVVIAGLVATLLNQPEWVEEFRPDEKPVVAVLVDGSRSMDTRDVVTAAATPIVGQSRLASSTSGSFVWLPAGTVNTGTCVSRSRRAASSGEAPSFQSPSLASTTARRLPNRSATPARGAPRSVADASGAAENGSTTTR
jgi:hypothetical protein